MEYNTSRNKLLLHEYGRNVQNMIAHAMEIENSEDRNKAAQAIIEVMGQLNPHLRDVDDYRHKLWAHLFIMSDFNLDVESPYEIPEKEALMEKPNEMPYPKSKIKFGHFGQYSQKILDGAKSLEDEKEIDYMTFAMGNFMKKQYLLHNNTSVDNSLIAKQLKELSEGKLIMENPEEDLVSTNVLLKTLGLENNQNQNNKRHNNNNNNNRNKQFGKKKFKR
tara:strand:+ start:1939 stop:2598 length:660 start_codon:yes stop_codon:yes gene_type:complete